MNRKQRHLGRELALLWLYQIDVGKVPLKEAIETIPDELVGLDEEGIEFGRQIVTGIFSNKKRIDQSITKYARGWALARLAAIERNVLRIALCEIMILPEIPVSVSIDQAVEIAKRYGSEESGKFVNGILGAYVREEPQIPEKKEPGTETTPNP